MARICRLPQINRSSHQRQACSFSLAPLGKDKMAGHRLGRLVCHVGRPNGRRETPAGVAEEIHLPAVSHCSLDNSLARFEWRGSVTPYCVSNDPGQQCCETCCLFGDRMCWW